MNLPLKDREPIYKRLPELKDLEEVIAQLAPYAKIETLTSLPYKGFEFPLYSISMGSEDLTKPCLLLTGGVHGLERIGSQVLISVLRSMARSFMWDEHFQNTLANCRIIFIPIMNPVGMYRMSRSNGNDVDLMRNSPVESEEKSQFLYGGHRISPRLPFFRGSNDFMEIENQALWRLVREKVFPSKVTIALDVHSGFGIKDRLWFPWAYSKKPFPYLTQMHALKELMDNTYQHHVYTIEPQAQQYTTHGDVWDYFLMEFEKTKQPEQIFVPLTLEMGSWVWIRKNPLQIFNPLGIFNPMSPHRARRMLRRHKNLVEFLIRAVSSPKRWTNLTSEEQKNHLQAAMTAWYQGKAS
ncbi:MAG: DUF2817 domain-containing protein [Bdellovibrionales bacterium]|nr:DUF2817 domain-containing protein [Bdellovibrionales bacterium]